MGLIKRITRWRQQNAAITALADTTKKPPRPPKRVAGRPLRPLHIGSRRTKVHMETIDRLFQLRALGRYHHEQMEAAADEACRLMGFNPDDDNLFCEIAKDVVWNALSPAEAMDQIADIQRHDQEAREADADF